LEIAIAATTPSLQSVAVFGGAISALQNLELWLTGVRIGSRLCEISAANLENLTPLPSTVDKD